MNIFPLKTHAAAARHIYPFTLFKPYDRMKLKYQEIVDNLVNMIMHKIKESIDNKETISINLFNEIYDYIGEKYNLGDGMLSNLIVRLSYRLTDLIKQYNESGIEYYDYWCVAGDGKFVIHILDHKKSLPAEYTVDNKWIRYIGTETSQFRKERLLAPHIDEFLEFAFAPDEEIACVEEVTCDSACRIWKSTINKEEVILSHGLSLTMYIDKMQELILHNLRKIKSHAKSVWYLTYDEYNLNPDKPLELLIDLHGKH